MALSKSPKRNKKYHQHSLFEFNGVGGTPLDLNNRWVVLSREIPWSQLEEAYVKRCQEEKPKAPTILGTMATTASRLIRKATDYLGQLTFTGLEEDLSIDKLALPNINRATLRAQMKVAEENQPSSSNGGPGGRKPYPFRVMLGSLIVQNILGTSDRDTERAIAEGPYFQAFLGYEGFDSSNTVSYSMLSTFRKKLDVSMMQELNEILDEARRDNDWYELGKSGHVSLDQLVESYSDIDANAADNRKPAVKGTDPGKDSPSSDVTAKAVVSESEASEDGGADVAGVSEAKSDNSLPNCGELIMDATCGPVYMRYPQDFALLNEARVKLDRIIDRLCHEYGVRERPRTYKKVLQKMVKDLSKTKRKGEEEIRHAICKLLNSLERNLEAIDKLLQEDSERELLKEEARDILSIRMVYSQQKEMYDNKTHRCDDRIVSIEMPFIRPIVRGKVNDNVEFGPKFDMSIDENGFSRIELFSYDQFNESGDLIEAVERYRKKHGHFPEKVLVDQIYRTTENLKYCKEKGIKVSGPKLGRKPKDAEKRAEQEAEEKTGQKKRIEVERRFSRTKHSFGLDCIVDRTAVSIGHAIGMGVFLENLVPIGF